MGNALPTFSEVGFGYAVRKRRRRGVDVSGLEELWNYGFPQEMAHFARRVRGKVSPIATGEDGRFVQQVLFAAYQSMGAGQRVDMHSTRGEDTDQISASIPRSADGDADTICHRSPGEFR